PTGRAGYFIYRIDIVDSLCDTFPIENNSLSGNPTPTFDSVVESLSPSHIPYGDSDFLVEVTDTPLSHFNDSSPDYDTFCFDIKKKSSGNTTYHSNHSLPEYEAFCFDIGHREETSSGSTTSISDIYLPDYEVFCFKEKSSGSTTTHSDYSLPDYDAFYFDDDHIEEKSSGSTTTHSDFSLPEYD
ncbi:hypothetical protein Tco_0049664, partial [Tanacetum coccineum]